MKKPPKDAPIAEQRAYRRWVRAQINAEHYVPRYNGVAGDDERRSEALLDRYEEITRRASSSAAADEWIDSYVNRPRRKAAGPGDER